jgi:tetrahydromethanopterin S-methyltransferase subunit F
MGKSKWTVDTLKEHFEKILLEKDRALSAALIAVKDENRKTEVAAERRFELLNELRAGVATKDQLFALEKVVEDLKTGSDIGKGKGVGADKTLYYIFAVAGFIGIIFGMYMAFKH